MRTDSGIQGLTTAATVWVNAAVGVAAGGGEFTWPSSPPVVTLAALLVLQPIERLDRAPLRRAAEKVIKPD